MIMAQFVSDVLRTMRLAISRRNQTDPDSDNATLMTYINNFIHLTMTEDVRLFEVFDTYAFAIDQTNTTGVYEINDIIELNGTKLPEFTTISSEAFISLSNPPAGSVSWNRLYIIQDPGYFYQYWGVNNETILIPGYPTMMLYYGTQFVFRTIPNTGYNVYIYAYKVMPEFDSVGNPQLPFDHWMRYLAYGAAMDYARDYNFDAEKRAILQADFAHERKLLLAKTHNQIKRSRALPRF
jgi:hypothetical protein